MAEKPGRIDRATFDRVLKRAAELQAGGHEISDDGMSESEALALGVEVGISEAQMKQALLEERVRAVPPADAGLLDRVIAPAVFMAERVVRGDSERVTTALIQWAEEREHLAVQRKAPGRVTFERIHALAGAMRKVGAVFDSSRGKPFLDKSELLTATVTPLEAGWCHVGLTVSLNSQRNAYIGGGVAITSIGVATSLILGVLGAASIMVGVPVLLAAGAGLAVARGYRPTAERGRIGLERMLDAMEENPRLIGGERAEEGGSRPGLLGREVGEAVRDFTREVRKALDK